MLLTPETILPPTIGGALIGGAAVLLLFAHGRIAGISGIVGGMMTASKGDRSWRGAFLLGLLAGGVVLLMAYPEAIAESPRSLGLTIIGGLLVGFGTRLGSGCTSGHGVCGISRLSLRGIVATVFYIGAGGFSVVLFRHILGVI